MQFTSLQITEPILKAVREEGYTVPTPIQQKAIPVVLEGKDLLGCAQTGTGKTAAFAIPIIQKLENKHDQKNKRNIRSLILTPTRELAIQIGESFDSYGRHTKVTNTVIFGGVNQNPQVKILNGNIDVLIATPGRLLDLINQGFISLSRIEIFVLDEADRMLDMGFIHDVNKIISMLPHKRQTLFFSATMPREIVKLSSSILNKPVEIIVSPRELTVDLIKQYVYFVDKGNKIQLLLEILKNEDIKNALIFTRTKHGADKVVRVLSKNNIKSEAIHGNKVQSARQRALSNFKAQTTRVLVATDIAARGIDIDELEYVFNFDLPNLPETYVHRIGRTGRAGAGGNAISFCNVEEQSYLRDIEKLITRKLVVIENHPFPIMDVNPVKVTTPVKKKETHQKKSNTKKILAQTRQDVIILRFLQD